MRSEGAHPAAMLTAAYLDETLDPQGVERFERHLARCATCRAGVVALKNLPTEGEAVPEPWLAKARASTRKPRSIWVATGALAAVVVIAVLVGLLAGKGARPFETERVYRAAGSEAIEALEPARGARVSGSEIPFRWSPLSGTDRYVVTILSAEGATLATLEVPGSKTEARWHATETPAFSGTFLWKVCALRDERVVGESRPSSFERSAAP